MSQAVPAQVVFGASILLVALFGAVVVVSVLASAGRIRLPRRASNALFLASTASLVADLLLMLSTAALQIAASKKIAIFLIRADSPRLLPDDRLVWPVNLPDIRELSTRSLVNVGWQKAESFVILASLNLMALSWSTSVIIPPNWSLI